MNIHITMMVNLKYNSQVKPVLRDHSYCHLSREVYSTEQRKSDDILMWTTKIGWSLLGEVSQDRFQCMSSPGSEENDFSKFS